MKQPNKLKNNERAQHGIVKKGGNKNKGIVMCADSEKNLTFHFKYP